MIKRVTILRSVRASSVHLIHLEGRLPALPDPVRHMGPWTRLDDVEVSKLRPAIRAMLTAQAFVVIEAHVMEIRKRLLA